MYEADEGNEQEGLLLDSGNEPYGTDALDACRHFAALMMPRSRSSICDSHHSGPGRGLLLALL